MEFKLPDLGEGVHEGEIVKWLVKEGDSVKEDQPMVEVMTDKATVEIPAPTQGKIQKLHFKDGDQVEVGQVLVTIAQAGESASKEKEPKEKAPKEKPKVLVPKKQETTVASSPAQVLATPAVRKLAKDLGVDLSHVKATGPGGRITEQDVRGRQEGIRHPEAQRAEGSHRFQPLAIPKSDHEERVPLRGVRKKIAERLQMSKHYAPHFTYVEEIDMTGLVNLRVQKKTEAESKGVKLTYLAYIVKALIPALKEFGSLNASLDETTQEIVYKKQYHIGIAVDTEDGLIVPVIQNVDQKDVYQVAKEIVEKAEQVRSKKIKPEDLKGSSFTVTSIGNIGGVFATPILNYPDVAILGVNKIVERPVVKDGQITKRHMVYLSLTLDHRVVDGAVAARFMNKLKELLENPFRI